MILTLLTSLTMLLHIPDGTWSIDYSLDNVQWSEATGYWDTMLFGNTIPVSVDDTIQQLYFRATSL